VAGRQSDVRYYPYQVTIPAGTDPFAPQTDDLPIAHGIARDVRLQIPSGHMGLTGWSLTLAGTTILPWGDQGVYIIADDDIIDFDLGLEVDIQLASVCYNLDVYDHTFYFRVAVLPIFAAAPAAPVDGLAAVGATPAGSFTLPALPAGLR
jgi:hypothetical protein